ncbi:MAG: DUF2442 domain-containing protein [Longimicrobiales bacterium]
MAGSNDFMKMYREAGRRAREYDGKHPKAIRAVYNREDRRMHIDLSSGALFAFPVDLAQGLAGAEDDDIANVEITPSGHGLHWPALDADLWLEALMAGEYGTRKWMEELRHKGSLATSRRKAAAKRANAKGGRTRKRVAKARTGKTGRRRSPG